MSFWDNGDPSPEDDSDAYSRGIILKLNYDDMTTSLVREFTNEARTFGHYEGSMQVLDPSNHTSNVMLGYGSQPFFTELDHEGNIILDAQFATDGDLVRNYRTFRLPWQGDLSPTPTSLGMVAVCTCLGTEQRMLKNGTFLRSIT